MIKKIIYPQTELPPWELGAAQAVKCGVTNRPWLASFTQQKVLRLKRAEVPVWHSQQVLLFNTLHHTPEKKQVAMLNPLGDKVLVHKVPKDRGEVLIWGVKPQLGKGG